MRRFKIFSFMIICAMLLSFTACTSSSNSDGASNESSDTEAPSDSAKTEKPYTEQEVEAKTLKGYILSASAPSDTYGNGMSFVYKLTDGRLFVFDGGNSSVKGFLIDALRDISGTDKPKVAAWVMTHDHGDHYGALINAYYDNAEGIKDQLEVEEFWMNPMNSEGYGMQENLKKAFPDANMRRLTYGEEITLDEIKITVLCTPDVIPQDPRNDVNTYSLVTMLNIGAQKILMTGDANEPAWDFMVAQQSKGEKYSLKCDFLQVPHHGVHEAGTAEGYAAANARYLLIPSTIALANSLTTESNAKPSYDLYKKHGINVGSLKYETNGTTYWFAGCYGRSGTQNIKTFFTYKVK